MPKTTDPYAKLEAQIQEQIDLLEQVVSDPDPASRVARLDSASRALMNILRSLKALRELSAAAEDPADLLRKALAELEAEWPELQDTKELLRNGGAVAGAVTTVEGDHAASA